jgi:endonuclease-3 related protein
MTKHLLQIFRILLEEYGPQHWWPGETQDEIIIGAILTQNTNWSNVEKAISNLKADDLLSLSALSKADPKTVAACIRPTGYYNQKAERLVQVSNALKNLISPAVGYELRQFLLSLKGIGPETADSILLYAYNLPYFVIDAYTQRIFCRLGLADSTSRYHELQNLFMQHLEADSTLYNEYHALLVRHAKVHCRKQPDCRNCPLIQLCSFALEMETAD